MNLIGLALLCLTPLSTIFQLYGGGMNLKGRKTFPKSHRQISIRGKIDTPKTNTPPLTFLAWYKFNRKWQG
jgi:hypothetical protein